MSSNMRLWDSVKDPDTTISDKAIKPVPGGAGLTAIDPFTLYAMATRLWGPEGISYPDKPVEFHDSYGCAHVPSYPCWGFEELQTKVDGEEHVCTVRFWYPNEVTGRMAYVIGKGCTELGGRKKDIAKQSWTDARTNAMSKVGFGASAYLGKFNDSKYVEDLKQRQRAAVAANEPEVAALRQDFASIHADVESGACTTEQGIERFKALHGGPFKALPQAGKDAIIGGVKALQDLLKERKAEGK